MPGIIIFNRRWSFGSDDLVVPGAFFAVLHMTWTVILGVIYGTVSFENSSGDQLCLTSLRQHVLGNIIIMSCCVLCEASIAHLAMRGTILHTHPRRGMKYLIYIRLGIFIVEHIWLVVGIVWISQYYTECQAPTPKKALLGIVVCNAVIMISVLLSMWCTFDGAGRSWVKLKRYQEGLKDKEKIPGHKRRSGSRRRNWRHSLIVSSKEYRKAIQMYERSWDKRCRTLFCCVGRDRHQGSFSEVARLFTEFFRDLDVVPSDIVAGLVLLRKQQKTRRREIVEQHTNEVYQFLSGVPISPSTRFLRLKNPSELAECQRVIHYMRYALAAYGWPMYMMTHAGTGICRIMPSLSCCCGGCCCCHEQKERVELDADNCCDCNLAALYKLLKLSKQDCSVIYCTYHCDIGETPFFVALDHVHRRVVVAIRGTTSLQDVLTDLKAEPEPLPVEPIREDWLAHKGMVQAAVYIKKQLRERQLLQAAFSQDIDRGTHDYDLAIVGHSLGAGTAAILAILLQQEHPGLHCYAFSPPGGLLSAPCVEHTKSFITSVVVGKDVVPRIGLYQLETLRQDLINVIKKSEKQKWRIIGGSLCCCCKERDTQPEPVTPEGVAMFDEVRAKRETRYFTHPTDSAIALTSHIPLYPPGNIIHVVRTHPQKTKTCSSEEPIYQAVWASNMDLDEVLISPTMVNDHMPETVLEALNKVLTNASPAKPTRLFTEEERKAMLQNHRFENQSNHNLPTSNSNDIEHQQIPLMSKLHFNFDPPECADTIVPLRSGYLDAVKEFDTQQNRLDMDPGENSGLAFCIPTPDAMYGTIPRCGKQSTMIEKTEYSSFERSPGGANERRANTSRSIRPRSFPPKPRPGPLRLDFPQHTLLDWSLQAPLATPETLSETSSMASINSRGSWLGPVYHRLSTDVAMLAPIKQSPGLPYRVLPTVHSIVSPGLNSTHGETSLLLPPASSPIDRLNSPEFQQAQISPIQDERRPLYDDISRPIETIIDVERLIGDNVGQNYSSKCSCNIQMEHQQSNCSVRLSSQSSLNDYVRHSPESTNQITYSWIDGAYSPAGRGYPHGTGIDPSSLNGQCVRTKLPDRGSKSSNSEQSFSPEELRALLSDENYRCDDRDLTSPELQEKDLQRRDSGICTCQCNAPTSSTANTPSHDQKPSLCIVSDFDNNKQDAATKTPFCTCTNLTKHQLNGPLVEEKVTITVNGIAKSLSDELPSEMPCLQITADVTTQPHNVFIKSEELRDPMLTSPDDEEYMRDDVSCSDSEPFMPHQVDSDGQTSPMDATLHLERFIQESRV